MPHQLISKIPGAPTFITRRQLAELTHRTVQGLAVLAMRGGGPPMYKPTPGRSLYKLCEVLEWIESGRSESTAEETVRSQAVAAGE